MRAGTLDHRIELQSYTTTNDGGDITRTWSTDATVWAQKMGMQPSDRYEAHQVEGTVDTKFRIRSRSVSSSQRIKHGGDIYQIEGAYDPTGRGKETIIEAVRTNA